MSVAGAPSVPSVPSVPSGVVRERPPLIGDDGYLEHLFAAFERGVVTEREWKQGERAHRFVVEAEKR